MNGTDCTYEFDEGAVDKLPWLSGRHECEWAFVKCDRDRFVTSIEMCEFFTQSYILNLYSSYKVNLLS